MSNRLPLKPELMRRTRLPLKPVEFKWTGNRLPLKPELMRRTRLPLKPVEFKWTGVFEKWARGFVARNFWRVQALFVTKEDAVQECAVIFVRCKNHYYGVVRQPQHFMALFKTSVQREWNTLSNKDTSQRNMIAEVETEERYERPSFWRINLAEASEEAALVVQTVLRLPDELLSAIVQDHDVQHLNRRLKRICGISKSTRDIVSELRELLE